ncbi:hypothetical protein EBT25_15345, partial [bacterium]|nr:hypothetical protein [bacterium]
FGVVTLPSASSLVPTALAAILSEVIASSAIFPVVIAESAALNSQAKANSMALEKSLRGFRKPYRASLSFFRNLADYSDRYLNIPPGTHILLFGLILSLFGHPSKAQEADRPCKRRIERLGGISFPMHWSVLRASLGPLRRGSKDFVPRHHNQ